MLNDYSNMPNERLVDLLAQETQKLTQLLGERQFTEEYEECKNIIRSIQTILESRKEQTVSEPPPSFTSPDTSF